MISMMLLEEVTWSTKVGYVTFNVSFRDVSVDALIYSLCFWAKEDFRVIS